jgi:succinate dehydrogenase / fumarate reductase membrane anchor subunit
MTTVEAPPPAPGTTPPRRSFEAKAWLFMRISGVALVVLALLHFAITHITNDVADTGSAFVARRWHNPLWRAFDWLLLALALVHGLNGVRWIVDDYVRGTRARRVTFAVVACVSLALFALGTFTIVTY